MPRKKTSTSKSTAKETVKKAVPKKVVKVSKKKRSPVVMKRVDNNKILVHITDAAAGKWKLIRPESVSHVEDIVKAAMIEVVSKVPKGKRPDIVEVLNEFSEKYTKNLKRQKAPPKKPEPYSQLRRNIARYDELLNSSTDRIEKVETEIDDCEAEIGRMESFMAKEQHRKDILPLFEETADTLGLAPFPGSINC